MPGLFIYAQEIIWIRRFDRGIYDWSIGGVVDPDGDLICVGAHTSSSPDPETLSVLIVKYNPEGETIWTRSFDSDAYSDDPTSVAVDHQGNIIIAANYSYDDTTYGAELLKFDRNGNLLWVQRPVISDSGYPGFYLLSINERGEIFCGGDLEHPRIPPEPDVLLMKFTPDGELEWSRIYDCGGQFWEAINSFTIDRDGNIVCAGVIGDDYPVSDFLLVKFSQAGDTLWCRRLDLYQDEGATGVAGAQFGAIFVSGWADDGNLHHPVLLRYSLTGELKWIRVYDWQWDAHYYDIALDSIGNLLLIGDCSNPPNGYGTSCMLVSYTPEGSYNWTQRYRLDLENAGFAIRLSGPNTAYLFGTCVDSLNNADMFVIKLRLPSGIESPDYLNPLEPGIKTTLISQGATVRLPVHQTADYLVTIYDLSGQARAIFDAGYLNAGEHTLRLPALPAGVYFLKVASAGFQARYRLVVVK
ncbi:MAG: T9SS type A sorting domain-containing protein [candidate division WOR-3 bacterium]